MNLNTILKKLERAKKDQIIKVIRPDINDPISIDSDTFQEMIKKRLPKWSMLNELKDRTGRYIHKCGYDNLYYATKSSKQLRYEQLN